MVESVAVSGVIRTLSLVKKLSETAEISISIKNNSFHTLSNVITYTNGTSIDAINPIIAPYTNPPPVRFETNLRGTMGMLCYQIEGTSYYLLISWKVPLLSIRRRNQFCVHVCESPLPEEQKEKNLFFKHVHKKYKKFSEQSIQWLNNNDMIIVNVTMSNR
ncbi:hypothetical protein C1645_822760 [Glomus cerebriforme]|uniref:Uncharacterized protein n=1 Tax=Glomus cerebriforme TaxID=658196 RepID=A0A397SZB3_9GLOM|nr:hypothetical protein C1645_822760 [Glomus cerebriforme]